MMNRRCMLSAAASMMLAGMFPLAAHCQEEDPAKWIVGLSSNILDQIRGDAKLQSADPERVRKFVDETVMPAVDFLRMTRMSVGPKWRQATPEQREELQKLFRETLIRVYSGALATVKDQTVKLAPQQIKPTDTDAVVRTLLVAPGKPDLRINYRLKKIDGIWRIIDVDVEGIWLVENYRSQFAGTLNSSGIEGLIQALREKTK